MLQKLAKTLAAHMAALLGYYDHPISTGPLEATNNKIKTMQRKAYGYRDLEFFTLKIYASHTMKYALVGFRGFPSILPLVVWITGADGKYVVIMNDVGRDVCLLSHPVIVEPVSLRDNLMVLSLSLIHI